MSKENDIQFTTDSFEASGNSSLRQLVVNKLKEKLNNITSRYPKLEYLAKLNRTRLNCALQKLGENDQS